MRYDGVHDPSDEASMNLEARVRAVEAAVIQTKADQINHERLCAERYAAIRADIKSSTERMGQGLKWLAIAVAMLALVVTGQATLADIVRSAASRVGVQIPATHTPPQPYYQQPQHR